MLFNFFKEKLSSAQLSITVMYLYYIQCLKVSNRPGAEKAHFLVHLYQCQWADFED